MTMLHIKASLNGSRKTASKGSLCRMAKSNKLLEKAL